MYYLFSFWWLIYLFYILFSYLFIYIFFKPPVWLLQTNSVLTVHGLQSDQTCDKVVKVYGHVGLRVTQDDQLEEVVG